MPGQSSSSPEIDASSKVGGLVIGDDASSSKLGGGSICCSVGYRESSIGLRAQILSIPPVGANGTSYLPPLLRMLRLIFDPDAPNTPFLGISN